MTDYSDILVTTPRPRVVRIQLNRPKQLNALRGQLLTELSAALGAAAFIEKRKPNFAGR